MTVEDQGLVALAPSFADDDWMNRRGSHFGREAAAAQHARHEFSALGDAQALRRYARLRAQPREFGHAFVKVLLDVVIDLSQGVVHRTNDGRVSNLKTLVCVMLTRLCRGYAVRA